jgi:hypothetical protein
MHTACIPFLLSLLFFVYFIAGIAIIIVKLGSVCCLSSL